MSEQGFNYELQNQVDERLEWMRQSAVEVGGADATPETVFVAPSKDDRERGAVEQNWTIEQETALRSLGERLNYASEYNVPTGLIGGVRLIEAGKTWKVLAELDALTEESDVKRVFVAGSPFVALGEDEKTFASEQAIDNLDGAETQYDVALALAQQLVATSESRALPYGYAVAEGNELMQGPSDQFTYLGKTATGQEVVVLRVDRQINDDKSYSFQPSQMRLLGLISEILTAQGDDESPVGLITSNAYASRQFEVMRAGLRNNRRFAVAMYGRSTLAKIKHEDMLPGARLNQLPGDLRLSYNSLTALQTELA